MNIFEQCAHPIRITIKTDDFYMTQSVLGVKTTDDQLSYMTVNGLIYTSQDIAYAEMFIDGKWDSITCTRRTKDKP